MIAIELTVPIHREAGTRRRLLATTALIAALAALPAFAEPTGAEIAAGHATVATSGARTSIVQSSDRAIIDWRSFSIGAGESVIVDQPGRSSVLLNRVRGSDASVLNGTLSANGQLMLVNPNGVMIGKGGIIDVGGFIATTADIRNEDFLAGRYNFAAASTVPGAGIRNHGIIRLAEDGYAVLSAAMVSNTGLIQARLGRIVLSGVETFTLDLDGDGRLRYQMGPVGAISGGGGSVANSGTLAAAGGDVLMTARAVKDVLGNVINNDGLVEATAAREVNGRIRIIADGGDVAVSGKLDVSSAAGQGGAVDITGRSLSLTGAAIDASGAAGGGTVRIGGDAHGEGSLAHAQRVAIDAASTVKANSTAEGNGGRIVAWSDGTTEIAAALSARGGAAGGDGGFIETSGKDTLAFRGSIDLKAPKGRLGDWLLDPTTVTVSDGSDTGDYSGATVTVGTLESATANITIDATSGITFNNLTGDQTIDLQSNVNLTMRVTGNRNIAFTDANDGITASGTGSITLHASTSNGTGSLNNIGKLTTASGSMTLNGADGATLAGAVTTSGGSVTVNADSDNGGGGSLTLSVPITTNGGNVSFNTGSGGITLNSTIDAAAGSVSFSQTGGSSPTITIGANAVIATSGSTPTLGPTNMSGGSLRLRVGSVDLSGATFSNASSGTLTLEPYSASANISINGSQTFDLSTSTLSQIGAFGSVIIGRSDGTGQISSVGSNTVSSALTLRSGATGGSIALGGALTADSVTMSAGGAISGTTVTASSGAASLTAGGNITLSGLLSAGTSVSATSGGSVTLSSGLTAPSGASLTAASALTVSGSVSMSGSSSTLTLKASSIDFSGASYNANTANDTVTLEPYTVSDGVIVNGTDSSSSTLDLSSSTISALDSNFSSIIIGRTDGTGQVSLGNSLTLSSAALTLRSGGTTGTVSQTAAVVLSGSGKALSYSAGGGISLGANVTTNAGAVTFGSNTTLLNVGTISLHTSGGAVGFSGTLNSASGSNVPISISSGSGAITFSGSTGTTDRLGTLTLTSTGAVNIGAVVSTTDSLSLSQTVNFTGTTTGILSGGDLALSGAVNFHGSSSDSVTFRGVSVDLGSGTLSNSAGTIVYEPAVASTGIIVNGTDGAGGSFDVTSSLISKASGFTGLIIGRTDGSGAVSLSSALSRSTSGQTTTFRTPSSGGSISLTAALTSAGGITLTSGGNIVLNGAALTTSGGAVQLQARASAAATTTDSTVGEIFAYNSSNITTSGGSITLGGSSDISTGYARSGTSAAGGVNFGRGIDIVDSTINAGGGNIAMRGQGADGVDYATGVDFSNSTVTTSGTGTISLTGVGGSGNVFSAGVNIFNGSSLFNTGTGAITFLGTSSASGSNPYGVAFDNSAGAERVYSTGGGAIAISALGSGAMLTGTTPSGNSNATIGSNGSTTYGSSISLTGDRISLANITVATTGAATLKNATTGRLIDVGSTSDSTSNTLELSTTELGRVTSGSLTIGSSTAGALTLSQAISVQTGGSLTLSGGGITQSAGATLTTGTLNLASTGGVTLALANSFSTLGSVSSTGGAVSILRSGGALSVTGAVSAGANAIDLRTTGGNLTLGSSSSFTTSGSNDIVLSTDGNFINNGTTLSAGRKYLIYSTNPSNNTKGTLPTYANLYNATYAANAPSSFTDSTSRLIYSYQPTVTVTPNASSKTYGDSDPTFSYSTSGLLDIDTVSSAISGSLSRTSGESVGNYTINSGLTSLQGYSISLGTATFTVNKAPLTITPTSATKVYGATDAMSFSATGLKFSDTAGSATTGALTRATGETVGSYAISLGTLASDNYSLSLASSPANFTITQAPLTITPTATSKTYGNSDPTLTYTTSGYVNGDTSSLVSGSISRSAGENAGTYSLSTGTVSAGSNYSVSIASGSVFTVNKAALSVTPTVTSKIYYDTEPTITYSVTGFKGSDTSAVLSGALARGSGETVGTYTITTGTLTASNYSISLTANTFTINRAVLTITPTTTTKVYGDADPTFLYTVSGLRSTDSAGSALSGDLGRVSGNNVGSYAFNTGTLTASNYELSLTPTNFTITKAPLTITPTYTTREYGATETTFLYSTTGLKYSDTIASALTGSLSRASGENVGSYSMSIGSLSASNYSLSLTPTNFVITQAPLRITVGDRTKIYGDQDPDIGSAISGLKGQDFYTGSLSREAGENTGVYRYTLGTFSAGANYSVTMTPATLSIREATLTITPTTTGKLIGDTEPPLAFSAEGFKRGDNLGTLTGSLTRATGETAGKYDIALGTLHDPNNNYKFVLVPKQFTISKGVITVTGVEVSKVYSAADPTFTYTVSAPSSIANPASLLTGSLGRAAGEDVGSYSLAIGTLSAGDAYELKFSGGKLTITPATLTVTPNSVSKVYGSVDPSLTYAVSGLQRSDTSGILTGALSRAAGSNVGGYAINIGTLTAGKNYKVELGGGAQLTITPAQLTVGAQPATKIYGDSDPAFTLSVSGLVNGDTVGSALTGTATRAPGENVGSYSINQGSVAAVGGNYTITFSNGASLTITQRPLTVTADNKTKVQREANPAFTLSYSGLANGDTGGVVIGVNASTSAADAPGSYPIVLSGGSATNYALTLVNGTLTVTPAPTPPAATAEAPPLPPAVAEVAPITAVTNTTTSNSAASSTTSAGAGSGGGGSPGTSAGNVTAALAPPAPPTNTVVAPPPSPTASGGNSPISAPTPQAASLSAADSIRSAASGMAGDDGGGSSEVIPGLLSQTPRVPVAVPEGTPCIEQNFPSLGRGGFQ